MLRYLGLLFVFSILFLTLSAKVSFSIDSDLGIATYLPIEEKTVKAGHIISSTNQGFLLTRRAYDQAMIGVVSDKPAISFDSQPGVTLKRYQVVTAGTVAVYVSSVNGVIKKGDVITSSGIPGVGMKATKTGYVLGAALEGMNVKDPQEIHKVNVILSLKASASQASAKTHLIDLGNLSAIALLEDPLVAFRYILAGLVVLLSIILGFLAFGRVAGRGIEAIGRNPLAARMIQLGVAINVLVTIAIIGAGIVVAILILTV